MIPPIAPSSCPAGATGPAATRPLPSAGSFATARSWAVPALRNVYDMVADEGAKWPRDTREWSIHWALAQQVIAVDDELSR